jgi:membrane protease YdiL (CAAX protease family)
VQQLQTDATSANPSHQVPSSLGTITKPRVWTVFLAAVVTTVVGFGATAVYIIIAGVILVASGSSRDPARITELVLENPNIIIPSFAIMGISTLFVTAICCLLSPERLQNRLSLKSSLFGLKAYIAAIAVTFGASIASSQLAGAFTNFDSPTLKLIERHLRSANSFMFALAAILIAGLAPVAEEAFFRGYMQTRLRSRWGAHWAIAISAISFGLFHADPVQTPFAIVMGVALGYVAECAGSIRPAIVCHMFNNLVSVIGSRFTDDEKQTSVEWIVVAVGIAASVSGVHWLRREARAKSPESATESLMSSSAG